MFVCALSYFIPTLLASNLISHLSVQQTLASSLSAYLSADLKIRDR